MLHEYYTFGEGCICQVEAARAFQNEHIFINDASTGLKFCVVFSTIKTIPESHPLFPCELGTSTYHRRRGAINLVEGKRNGGRSLRKRPCIHFSPMIYFGVCEGGTTLNAKSPRLHTPKG